MILESMKCLLGNRKQFHFGWKLRGQEIEYQKGIKVFQKKSQLDFVQTNIEQQFTEIPIISKYT